MLLSLMRPAANTLVLPVLVAAMSPSDVGRFVLLAPLWWLCQSLLSLGANESLARLVAKGCTGVAGALLLITATIGVFGVLLAAALMAFSGGILGIPWSFAVLGAVLLGVSQAVIAVSVAVLRVDMRVRAASIALAASTLATVVPGVFSVLLIEPSADAYYMAAAVGGLLVAGVASVATMRGHRRDYRDSWTTFRRAVRLGIPLMPQLMASLVIDLLARRVVLAFGGLAAVGVFGVAIMVGSLLSLIVKSVVQAWGPVFFRKDQASAVSQARLVATVGVSGVLLATAVIPIAGFAASSVIDNLGYRADSMIIVATLAACAAAPHIVVLVLTYASLHSERTGLIAWTAIVGPASGLLCGVILAQVRWELIAVALPLGHLASGLLMLVFSRDLRQWGVPPPTVSWAILSAAVGVVFSATGVLESGGGWIALLSASIIGAAGVAPLVLLWVARVRGGRSLVDDSRATVRSRE
ncbi:hypothetical protein H9633_03195 [Microbacterium sp. Re1]|uniref:Membrane protein involved in the export of O-antigen and teichoic acid n=2 Tax=Microbacterium commune TaxID=2762219 RepID=A0ABR8W2Q4_9MICO|nr:hypothetical protein [Microbacterium commune]